MLFVYDFFKTYVSFVGPVRETVVVDDVVLEIEATPTEFRCDRCDVLERVFLPCVCDAGHPYLFALRPFFRPCSCASWLSLDTSIQKTLATVLISHGVHRERQARSGPQMVS